MSQGVVFFACNTENKFKILPDIYFNYLVASIGLYNGYIIHLYADSVFFLDSQ